MSKYGIVITTYKRKNNSSFEKLKRSIQSIQKQSFKDWKLYLIGDHYEDEQEFNTISSFLPKEKIKIGRAHV